MTSTWMTHFFFDMRIQCNTRIIQHTTTLSTLFYCGPKLQPFLNIPLRRFFKRVKNKLWLKVKQPPLEKRRWDWWNSERWCQAHRDFKKYILQQIRLCAGFSWIPGWLEERTSQYVFVCEGAAWFCSQTSLCSGTLCLLDSFMLQRGLRGESRSKMLKTLLAGFAFHSCLTSCQLTDISWPRNQ